MAKERTAVGVLDRSVAILDAVEFGARSFTGIAEATGLTKPTAHRLISALESHGLLMHVTGVGYTLGPRFLALASSAMHELPLQALIRPFLEELARTTGESAQLYVRDGERRICVDAVESDNELRTIVRVGASLPLDKGSAGKVLLAWGPVPPGGGDSVLIATRRRGWADSYGEREEGVASVSAPILGPHEQLLAAISVSGPEARLTARQAKRYGPALVETASRIEALVGR